MSEQHDAHGDFVSFGAGAPTPESPRKAGRTKKVVVGGLGVVLVGGVVAGGLAAGSFLSGGGTQPEEVLPASTVAFAKIDLDPSASQKLDALQLMGKFPDARPQGDDIKAALVKKWFDDNPYGLTYQHDLAPWVGDRAAVAAVATSQATDGLAPVLAVQFTDRAAMTASLHRAEAALRKEGRTDGFHYAVRDDYVLITDTEAEATGFAGAAQVLADDPAYATDAADIDAGNQIGLAWANLGEAYKVASAEAMRAFSGELPSAKVTGRVVAGLHVTPDAVEVVGQTHGMSSKGSNPLAAAHPGTSLVRGMPADATAAVSLTGLGPALAKAWDTYRQNDFLGIGVQARQYGVRLPDDLEAVFGSEFALAVKDKADRVDVAVRVRTDRAQRAQHVLVPLLDLTGEPDLRVVPAEGGYAVGSDSAMLDTTVAGSGGLGTNPRFTSAVPDAKTANALLYVDIADLVDQYAKGPDRRNLAPLAALGASSTGTSADSRFTIRLTTR